MEISGNTLRNVACALIALSLAGSIIRYFVPAYRLQGGILLWASLFALNYLLFWLFWRFVRRFINWSVWKLLAGLVIIFVVSLAMAFAPNWRLLSALLFCFSVLSCFPLLAEELVILAQGLVLRRPAPNAAQSSGSASDNPWGEGTIPTLKGDMVQSHGEKVIADFLHIHKIDYEYDQRLTIGGHWARPDFYLTGAGIIIEYWGMRGDADYDVDMKKKKTLYMENGQKFISIGREDIRNINDVLKTKLARLGVVFEK